MTGIMVKAMDKYVRVLNVFEQLQIQSQDNSIFTEAGPGFQADGTPEVVNLAYRRHNERLKRYTAEYKLYIANPAQAP